MKKALSLLELIIAIALLSIATLAFFSLHLFGSGQQSSSTKQTVLQNEVSHALEHITKTLQMATGNTSDSDPANRPITNYTDANGRGFIVRVQEVSTNTLQTPKYIAYRQENTAAGNNSQIIYYYDVAWAPATKPTTFTQKDIISNKIKIIDTSITDPKQWGMSWGLDSNNLNITVTACWYPDEVCPGNIPCSCGSQDNPQVRMHTNIKMPAVSCM